MGNILSLYEPLLFHQHRSMSSVMAPLCLKSARKLSPLGELSSNTIMPTLNIGDAPTITIFKELIPRECSAFSLCIFDYEGKTFSTHSYFNTFTIFVAAYISTDSSFY
jgi:hypothetical protein